MATFSTAASAAAALAPGAPGFFEAAGAATTFFAPVVALLAAALAATAADDAVLGAVAEWFLPCCESCSPATSSPGKLLDQFAATFSSCSRSAWTASHSESQKFLSS